MNIRKMLDLSTAHLSVDCVRFLENRDGGGLETVYPFTYGWIVHVPDSDTLLKQKAAIPHPLFCIVEHALIADCDFIMFDADGEVDNDFPVFNL